MIYLLAIAGVLTASYSITHGVLALSHRLQLIDIPNQRSSHVRPTARGGGVGFVISSSLAIGLGTFFGVTEANLTCAFLLAGTLVAAIGFVDDRVSLSPAIRFGGQVLAACILLFFIGLPSQLPVGIVDVSSKYFIAALAVVFIVWLINLANFMDGIDGLAATECIFVLAARATVLYCFGIHSASFISVVIVTAVLGFLLLNWSPAKIFMGDVGSGFLGVVYGGLILFDTAHNFVSLWIGLILLSAFLADGTVTLVRRLQRGEVVWQAHRTHLYQHAAARWGHARTTIAYMAINVFWLGPLAWGACKWPNSSFLLFAIAITPLMLAAWILGAGKSALSRSR